MVKLVLDMTGENMLATNCIALEFIHASRLLIRSVQLHLCWHV
jgi:hypothetical protein